MSFLDRFRKKTEDEASRIARLSKTGRMADGRIIDAVSDNDGRITQVTYTYVLAGVQYESSQALSDLSNNASNDYAPGKQIVVRYDPGGPRIRSWFELVLAQSAQSTRSTDPGSSCLALCVFVPLRQRSYLSECYLQICFAKS